MISTDGRVERSQSWLRTAAIRLTAYLATAYLTVGMALYLKQDKLLFPAPKDSAKTTPAVAGLPFEDLRIRVNARDSLHAWWIPAATLTSKAILVFHGNAYTLERYGGG